MSSFSNLFSKLLRLDRLKKGKAKDSHSKVKTGKAEKSALERIHAAILYGNMHVS
ncbi:BnaCnng40890D [Brassica napus]|uniref:BnaCnng40890D protein n=1 Tax=Brassica napus TaxID=3708 RepID=A0A078JAH6_BRANA|nr:BnaCnng40890D [Brassica napus]